MHMDPHSLTVVHTPHIPPPATWTPLNYVRGYVALVASCSEELLFPPNRLIETMCLCLAQCKCIIDKQPQLQRVGAIQPTAGPFTNKCCVQNLACWELNAEGKRLLLWTYCIWEATLWSNWSHVSGDWTKTSVHSSFNSALVFFTISRENT